MCQMILNLIHGKSNMVNSLTSFFNEFTNRTFRISRFEQLNFCLSDHQKSCSDLLISNFLNFIALQPHHPFIKINCTFKVDYSYSNMFNM